MTDEDWQQRVREGEKPFILLCNRFVVILGRIIFAIEHTHNNI